MTEINSKYVQHFLATTTVEKANIVKHTIEHY